MALDEIKQGLKRIEQSIDILTDQQSDQHTMILPQLEDIGQGIQRISPKPLPVKDWITEEEWAARAQAIRESEEASR